MNAPTQDSTRTKLKAVAIILLDMIAFNLLYYFFLRSVLLYPPGYSSLGKVIFFGLMFISGIFIFDRFHDGARRGWRRLWVLQAAFFLLIALGLHLLAGIMPEGSDTDYSWLRPEIIKTPLWVNMFVSLSPVFTLIFWIQILLLMWLAIDSPKSRILLTLPCLGFIALFWVTKSAVAGINKDYFILYLTIFSCPMLAFWILLLLRMFRSAFRLAPLSFHATMICLNYFGVLPVHHTADLIPFTDARSEYIEKIPGASFIYPLRNESPDNCFLFPRKIFKISGRLVINCGPMGMSSLISIDQEKGRTAKLNLSSLMRDTIPSHDGEHILGLNWQESTLMVFEKNSFQVKCSISLRPFKLYTPWNFIARGDRLYVTNVTPPRVAEFSFKIGERCELSAEKILDFREVGYTGFTDGAFGLMLDVERNKLYVLVGLLEGRYLLGLTEIDPDSFTIIRDIRLPSGVSIFPLEGTDRVLLPSYYFNKIYEVSLREMKRVRTIEADANIFSLEYDGRRELIYAVSRSSGIFMIIDYKSGKILRSVVVGAKSEPLWLEKETDLLYIGSKLGIMQIDLEKFLKNEKGGCGL